MNRTIEKENSFMQVLLKLIPSELIAVFVFIQDVTPRILWPHLVIAVVLVALTPLYLSRAAGVRSRPQLVVTTLSLVLWIYAMGTGPFRFVHAPFYEPWHGAVVLAVWTLVPPMFLTADARRGTSAVPRRGEPASDRQARARPRSDRPAPTAARRGAPGRASADRRRGSSAGRRD